MTAGFLVISFIATIFIVAPSVVFFGHGWRSNNLSRAFVLGVLAIFVAIAWAAFSDSETPDFESKAVIFYGVWAVILYLGTAVYLGARTIARFIKRRHV